MDYPCSSRRTAEERAVIKWAHQWVVCLGIVKSKRGGRFLQEYAMKLLGHAEQALVQAVEALDAAEKGASQ